MSVLLPYRKRATCRGLAQRIEAVNAARSDLHRLRGAKRRRCYDGFTAAQKRKALILYCMNCYDAGLSALYLTEEKTLHGWDDVQSSTDLVLVVENWLVKCTDTDVLSYQPSSCVPEEETFCIIERLQCGIKT